MNATLLQMLVRDIRADAVDRSLGVPSWFPPVLAIPIGGVGVHLVAVLEPPGPFVFFSNASPFGAAHAPRRFAKLGGAKIKNLVVPEGERVLRIEAVTKTDHEPVSLSLRLFGPAGAAELSDANGTIEALGAAHAPASAPREHTAPPGAAAAVHAPFFLASSGRPGIAAPVDGAGRAGAGDVLGPFDTARAACAHLGGLILESAHATIIHRITRPVRKKADALRRLAANLESDLEGAHDHERLRREAETLAAYQSRVPSGAASVTLPDAYDSARELSIELNPAEPVHMQIEKRFRRATKLAKSVEHAARRLELVRREMTELDAALTVLERAGSFEQSLRVFEALRAKFGIEPEGPRVATAGSARRKPVEKTYRRFALDPRWFALVGRSNHENDEITFRLAAPTDLWFHAQGVPGSHVVLKSRGGSDGPPPRVVEATASLAAHFSKARHSSLVPVIYTQRKYVRKFRGARPGQVTCERETMLMVPPTLPGPPERDD